MAVWPGRDKRRGRAVKRVKAVWPAGTSAEDPEPAAFLFRRGYSRPLEGTSEGERLFGPQGQAPEPSGESLNPKKKRGLCYSKKTFQLESWIMSEANRLPAVNRRALLKDIERA